MHEPAPHFDPGADAGGGSAADIASPLEQEPLTSVRLQDTHAVAHFKCERSPRVQGFLAETARDWVARRYCRVFIIECPDDPCRVLGYYTLTPALLIRGDISKQDQKRVPTGIPVPLIRLGFLGRDDGAPQGLGASLIIDAARRVHRNPDIPAWGLMLDSEGGEDNPKLMDWYRSVGFKSSLSRPAVMYGPLKAFSKELV